MDMHNTFTRHLEFNIWGWTRYYFWGSPVFLRLGAEGMAPILKKQNKTCIFSCWEYILQVHLMYNFMYILCTYICTFYILSHVLPQNKVYSSILFCDRVLCFSIFTLLPVTIFLPCILLLVLYRSKRYTAYYCWGSLESEICHKFSIENKIVSS